MALNIKSFNDLFRSSLYNELDKLCDATIVAADGTEFKAHKLFLSLNSGYFKAYFTGNIEKKERLVLSFNKDVLENILIFIYTGEARFDSSNIASMIIASDYLLIDDLLTQCKYFALSEISTENCMSLLITSYIVERLNITKQCYRFVQINFRNFVHTNSGIEELPYFALKSLLNDDSLGVDDEETVWKAIVIWVKEDYEERLKHVPELLNCIRWKSVSYILVLCISEHPIVRENTFCKSKVIEKDISTGRLNSSSERCPSKMRLFIFRKPSGSGSELYLTYDGNIDIWRKIGEAAESFNAMFSKGRFVYMFNTISREMKTFDLLQKTWVEKENIRSFRQSYCVVESQDGIYIVGGYISMTASTDVEFYDPIKDSWKFCKPVPSINVCGAAIIQGKLYVIGYHEDYDILEMAALAYDLICDCWSNIQVPRQFRTNFGIINFRDQLYIFGGKTEDSSQITSVETYNVLKDIWEEFPSLPFPYELPQAIIVQDKLMVYDDCPVGGMSASRFLPCIWNDEVKTWDVENIISPFNEIHRYVLCCIEDREILRQLFEENQDSATLLMKTPFGMEC